MALTFEWDLPKAARNLAKHGVAFEEAVTVFADPLGSMVSDPRHSVAEDRFILFGFSDRRRLLGVMFTEREPDRFRLFSARRATRRERLAYEEAAH
jgi:uncharacterized DUF497 family protein